MVSQGNLGSNCAVIVLKKDGWPRRFLLWIFAAEFCSELRIAWNSSLPGRSLIVPDWFCLGPMSLEACPCLVDPKHIEFKEYVQSVSELNCLNWNIPQDSSKFLIKICIFCTNTEWGWRMQFVHPHTCYHNKLCNIVWTALGGTLYFYSILHISSKVSMGLQYRWWALNARPEPLF